ncbi:RIN4, pathogenic type III effector avirulence factor Avr cleavage site, partial [Dillenia turbinata]
LILCWFPIAQQDKGQPLPKFGEWDVNNPASADGFTVIFNKARDEKKGSATSANAASPRRNENNPNQNETYQYPTKKRWFCCG